MLFGELFVIMSGLGRGVRESTYIHSLSPALDLLLHCLIREKDQKILGTGSSWRMLLLYPRSTQYKMSRKDEPE